MTKKTKTTNKPASNEAQSLGEAKELNNSSKINHQQMLSDAYWQIIESLEWGKDGDYKRTQNEFRRMKISGLEKSIIADFVREKVRELNVDFKQHWLANDFGWVSDDSWWDLRAEVVGRGKEFYENISVYKLGEMAANLDYRENFQYTFSDFQPLNHHSNGSRGKLTDGVYSKLYNGKVSKVGAENYNNKTFNTKEK